MWKELSIFLTGFVMQFIFALVRTINVRQIADKKTIGTVISGTCVAALWLLTTKFGIDAIQLMSFFGISGYLVGAGLGTYVTMKFDSMWESIYKSVTSTRRSLVFWFKLKNLYWSNMSNMENGGISEIVWFVRFGSEWYLIHATSFGGNYKFDDYELEKRKCDAKEYFRYLWDNNLHHGARVFGHLKFTK